jgi:hypothetical protein
MYVADSAYAIDDDGRSRRSPSGTRIDARYAVSSVTRPISDPGRVRAVVRIASAALTWSRVPPLPAAGRSWGARSPTGSVDRSTSSPREGSEFSAVTRRGRGNCSDEAPRLQRGVLARRSSRSSRRLQNSPAWPHSVSLEPFGRGRFRHRVSPGTVVYNDAVSLRQLPPSVGYKSGALVVSTVISRFRIRTIAAYKPYGIACCRSS